MIKKNYDDIIENFDNIFNLNLKKKYRTLAEIKKILKQPLKMQNTQQLKAKKALIL